MLLFRLIGQEHLPQCRAVERPPLTDLGHDAQGPGRLGLVHVEDFCIAQDREMNRLLNLLRQLCHDRLGDLNEVHSSEVGVSEFEGSQTESVFPGFFLFFHQAAFLKGQKDPIGGAPVETQSACQFTDPEVSLLS